MIDLKHLTIGVTVDKSNASIDTTGYIRPFIPMKLDRLLNEQERRILFLLDANRIVTHREDKVAE